MLDLDPVAPLDETATNAFSHTVGNAPNFIKSYKIVGTMSNVVIQGDAWNAM